MSTIEKLFKETTNNLNPHSLRSLLWSKICGKISNIFILTIPIVTSTILINVKLVTLLFVSCLLFASSVTTTNANNELSIRPSSVLELTSDNYDQQTGKYQIVVLNFYADWCPYSARWKPLFQETAKIIYNETSHYDPYTIVFGQINCEVQTTLAQRFRITKFPTTKVTLNGKPLKKEYRGARNSVAFREYVQKYLTDPIIYAHTSEDLNNGKLVNNDKAAIVMFSGRIDEHEKPIESSELQTFKRVAQQLREDCQFVYVLNSASGNRISPPDLYSLNFKKPHSNIDILSRYVPQNSLNDFESLSAWAKKQCIPLVREITFENAEELTEEGLPFVILFYDPKDKSWIEIFRNLVERELVAEAKGVTFLYADGHVFSHPLKHLGKTIKDLPLVAIDSFKHLFLYKHPILTITEPGNLKQFIFDLHSGKLDREFHFGPDPVANSNSVETSAPESAFNKLAPSASRYSLLMPRDEL